MKNDNRFSLLQEYLVENNCKVYTQTTSAGFLTIEVEIEYLTMKESRTFEQNIGIEISKYINMVDDSSHVIITIKCRERNSVQTFFMPEKKQFQEALAAISATLAPHSDEEYQWNDHNWENIYFPEGDSNVPE